MKTLAFVHRNTALVFLIFIYLKYFLHELVLCLYTLLGFGPPSSVLYYSFSIKQFFFNKHISL